MGWALITVVFFAGIAFANSLHTSTQLEKHGKKPWHDQAGPVITENRITNRDVDRRLSALEKGQVEQNRLLNEILRRIPGDSQ